MPNHPEATESPPPPVRGSLRVDEALGALAMAAICVISIGNVAVRYLTNASFAFTEEFSVVLLVIMTMVGTAFAFATGSHIRITFLIDRMGPRGRRAAEAFSVAATVLVFALVMVYGALFAYDQWEFDETSAGLGYPSWIYSAFLPLLAALVILRAIRAGVASLRGRR